MTLSIITIAVVIAILIALYIVRNTVIPKINDTYGKSKELDKSLIAKILNNSASSFETALKDAFNAAMKDGVITKEEAIDIVVKTFSAVKDGIIKSSSDSIQNEEYAKDKQQYDEDDDE